MKRVFAGVSLAAMLALSAGAAPAQTKSITLGASVQITGALANPGHYYRDAYQLAVDQINAKGGITVAGQRYQFALKVLDNQSDVNLGVRQYVQLITSDKVDFLLGPFNSNDALDDSSVAEKYQIPFVQGGGASSQIFARGYKYVFGTLPPADDYFGSTFEMLAKLEPKPKTAALLSADDSFDVSVAKGTRKLLEKSRLTTVLDEQYAEHNSDFTTLLSLLKSKEPDILLWGGHEPEALNFIRQSKSLDFSPEDLASFTVGVPTADFRKALGKDADYAFGMTVWLPSATLKDDWFGDAEAFAKQFQEKYGYPPDYHVASAVADVETYAKAIVKAGSLDRQKVRDAIAEIDFECLYARVRYAENGQIDLPQTAIQIQNGQLVPVYTDHFLNKPQYPVPAWTARH